MNRKLSQLPPKIRIKILHNSSEKSKLKLSNRYSLNLNDSLKKYNVNQSLKKNDFKLTGDCLKPKSNSLYLSKSNFNSLLKTQILQKKNELKISPNISDDYLEKIYRIIDQNQHKNSEIKNKMGQMKESTITKKRQSYKGKNKQNETIQISGISQNENYYQQNNNHIDFYARIINDIKSQLKKQKPKAINFTIISQFSIQLSSNYNKINKAIQITPNQFQQNTFIQYVKNKNFKQKIKQYVVKSNNQLQKIIFSLVTFNQNYSNLIKYIDQFPKSLKHKQLYALNIDIQKSQNKLKQQIQKAKNQIQNAQTFFQQNKTQLDSTIQKIKYLQIKPQKQLKQTKDQIKNYDQINVEQNHNNIQDQFLKIIKNITSFYSKQQNQIQNLKKQIYQIGQTFNQLTKLFYENRVHIYNCINKLKQVSLTSTSLLQKGSVKQKFPNQKISSSVFHQQPRQKCNQCQLRNRKQSYIQYIHSQTKQVFKCLQWLLRDGSKPKNMLAVI